MATGREVYWDLPPDANVTDMILDMPFIATCTMPLRRRWQQVCHFHLLEPEISSINSISVQIQTSKPVKLPWRKEDCFGAGYGSPSVQSITIALAFARMQEKKGMARRSDLPLVYSCSGCSSAAQLANHLAIRLDRSGKAEMSCIAGVGGDVPSLVRVATSGRPIIAIDGCALKCVQNCLARHGVQAEIHYDLAQFGVKKRFRMDFDPEQADQLFEWLANELP
jgi:uncharacterized metal-binding protein